MPVRGEGRTEVADCRIPKVDGDSGGVEGIFGFGDEFHENVMPIPAAAQGRTERTRGLRTMPELATLDDIGIFAANVVRITAVVDADPVGVLGEDVTVRIHVLCSPDITVTTTIGRRRGRCWVASYRALQAARRRTRCLPTFGVELLRRCNRESAKSSAAAVPDYCQRGTVTAVLKLRESELRNPTSYGECT